MAAPQLAGARRRLEPRGILFFCLVVLVLEAYKHFERHFNFRHIVDTERGDGAGARCQFPAARALHRTERRTEEVRVGTALGADETSAGTRTDAYELPRRADHAHHGTCALA